MARKESVLDKVIAVREGRRSNYIGVKSQKDGSLKMIFFCNRCKRRFLVSSVEEIHLHSDCCRGVIRR